MGTIKGIKIDLALSDDLKQSASLMYGAIELINNSIKGVDKASQQLKVDVSTAGKIQMKESSSIDKAEEMAKNLGVDVNVVPGYKDCLVAFSKLEASMVNAKEY